MTPIQSQVMVGGRDRLEIPFCWPSHLLFDYPRLKTIYLDLNHWIGLAQASVGHPKGTPYIPVLEQALSLVERKLAVFPLSGHIYMEMSTITDPRQRTDLANVMRDLSGYRSLLSLPLLMEMEVCLLYTSPSPRD